MAAPERAAAGTAGGASSPPLWQQLPYPDERTFATIMDQHIELGFDAAKNEPRDFYALPPWVRLGWPAAEVYDRAKGNKALAVMPWAKVIARYPPRAGVSEREQDLWRILNYWPKQWGEDFVEVVIRMKGGVHFASAYPIGKDEKGRDIMHAVELDFSPGRHRLPKSVAAEVRYADQKAHEEYINQFIPKVHQDKVTVISGTQYPGMVSGA